MALFPQGIDQMTDMWNYLYACRRKENPEGVGKQQRPCNTLLHRSQSADAVCPAAIISYTRKNAEQNKTSGNLGKSSQATLRGF